MLLYHVLAVIYMDGPASFSDSMVVLIYGCISSSVGATIFMADLNGDGEKDAFCINNASYIRISGYWIRQSTDFCPDSEPDNTVTFADFNGDKRDDFFCYSKKLNTLQVKFAQKDGIYFFV